MVVVVVANLIDNWVPIQVPVLQTRTPRVRRGMSRNRRVSRTGREKGDLIISYPRVRVCVRVCVCACVFVCVCECVCVCVCVWSQWWWWWKVSFNCKFQHGRTLQYRLASLAASDVQAAFVTQKVEHALSYVFR